MKDMSENKKNMFEKDNLYIFSGEINISAFFRKEHCLTRMNLQITAMFLFLHLYVFIYMQYKYDFFKRDFVLFCKIFYVNCKSARDTFPFVNPLFFSRNKLFDDRNFSDFGKMMHF